MCKLKINILFYVFHLRFNTKLDEIREKTLKLGKREKEREKKRKENER